MEVNITAILSRVPKTQWVFYNISFKFPQMLKEITKYIRKAHDAKLACPDDMLVMALDAELYCNQTKHPAYATMSDVFKHMNITCLIYAKPLSPYREIISYFCSQYSSDSITPTDCETRTFFHEIPLVRDLTSQAIACALSKRKSAIICHDAIVSYGTVTVEQAYVSLSSTCFSIFVKYFYDALVMFKQSQRLPDGFDDVLKTGLYDVDISAITTEIDEATKTSFDLSLIVTAGALVRSHLVDSFFGNISCKVSDIIYISQTGSSLDELSGHVDEVPINGSSTTAITASSELPTHKAIYQMTDYSCILHAHPRFAVIMSMYCEHQGCDRSLCHKRCDKQRFLLDIPVVSGEIGTGKTSILHTVPEAISKHGIVIVYGHGIFVATKGDFKSAFCQILEAEKRCMRYYLNLIGRSNLAN